MSDQDYQKRKQRALSENPHGLVFEEAQEAYFHYFTQAGRNELNDYLALDMRREVGELTVSVKGMRGQGRKHLRP